MYYKEKSMWTWLVQSYSDILNTISGNFRMHSPTLPSPLYVYNQASRQHNVFFILTLTNSYAFVYTQVALDYAMYGDWSSRYLITPPTLTNVRVIQVEFNSKLLTGKSDFQVKCLYMGGSEPHNALHWGWELVLTHQLPPGMTPKISKSTLSLLYV